MQRRGGRGQPAATAPASAIATTRLQRPGCLKRLRDGPSIPRPRARPTNYRRWEASGAQRTEPIFRCGSQLPVGRSRRTARLLGQDIAVDRRGSAPGGSSHHARITSDGHRGLPARSRKWPGTGTQSGTCGLGPDGFRNRPRQGRLVRRVSASTECSRVAVRSVSSPERPCRPTLVGPSDSATSGQPSRRG